MSIKKCVKRERKLYVQMYIGAYLYTHIALYILTLTYVLLIIIILLTQNQPKNRLTILYYIIPQLLLLQKYRKICAYTYIKI